MIPETKIKYIRWIFYVWLFLLPGQTGYFWGLDQLVYPLRGILVTDVLLILWAIPALSVLIAKASKSDQPSPRIVAWAVFYFICLAFISIINSRLGDPVNFHWIRFALCLGAVSLVPMLKPQYEKIVGVLATAGVVQAVLGTAQFIAQSSWSSKWLGMALHDAGVPGTSVVEIGLERWLRAYGSFPHPNILGGFMVLVLILLAGFYLKSWSESRRESIWALGAYVICLGGLVVSFSRSAWLAWAISFLLMGAAAWRKYRVAWFKLLGASLVIWFFFFIVWQPLFIGRFTLGNRLESKSVSERQFWNNQSWELIKAHPLRGFGFGRATAKIREQLKNKWPAEQFQPPHNIYILSWAEIGVGALLFWLALAVLWGKQLGRAFKSGDATKLSLVLPLGVFLLIGFFDHYLLSLPIGFALLGLSIMLASPS